MIEWVGSEVMPASWLGGLLGEGLVDRQLEGGLQNR